MDAQTKPFRVELPFLAMSAVAVYFAVAFALGAAKAVLLLELGTADYTAAALSRAVGYAFEPTLDKLMLVTALVSAAKLAIASFFALAVMERWSAAMKDSPPWDYDALDIALLGALALTVFLGVLAWIASDAAGLRTHMVHVILICVGIGLSMVERENAARVMTRVGHLEGRAGTPQSDEVLSLNRVSS